MLCNNDLSHNEKGNESESLAVQYLLGQGLKLKTRNFHSRQGEIDIVMQEQQTLVFIEVKYRKNNNFGGALAAIPYKKQQKIRKCATFYLQSHDLNEYNTDCRFDVIALQGSVNQPHVTWLKNAF